jgi:hypothetical protein
MPKGIVAPGKLWPPPKVVGPGLVPAKTSTWSASPAAGAAGAATANEASAAAMAIPARPFKP